MFPRDRCPTFQGTGGLDHGEVGYHGWGCAELERIPRGRSRKPLCLLGSARTSLRLLSYHGRRFVLRHSVSMVSCSERTGFAWVVPSDPAGLPPLVPAQPQRLPRFAQRVGCIRRAVLTYEQAFRSGFVQQYRHADERGLRAAPRIWSVALDNQQPVPDSAEDDHNL